MLLAAFLLLADPPRPPKVEGLEVKYSAEEGALNAQRFGRCLAQSNPKKAAQLLDKEPSSPNYGRVFQNLYGTASHCWDAMTLRADTRGTFLVMEPVAIRGALAEGLLLTRQEPPVLAASSAMPFRLHVFPQSSDKIDEKLHQANGVLFGIADCVVSADPATVDALARSDALSAVEREKLRSLQPALAGCIPQGQAVALERRRLRAALSEALYVATNSARPTETAAATDEQD